MGEAQLEEMYWPGGEVHPQAPGVEFNAPSQSDAGLDLLLRLYLQETDERTPVAVGCFYRIAHKALEFKATEMQAGAGRYATTISGSSLDAAWDLMVFFEFKFRDMTSTRWPDWRTGTP